MRDFIIKDGVLTNYRGEKTRIEIPDSVTSIGDGAFAVCHNLMSITIPNSVTRIGDGAFEECRNLRSITIPDSVTSIGEYAFARCSNLRRITIPNSVASIGKGAFYGCVGLADSQGLGIVRDVLYTCQNGLPSITVPDSVTKIGDDAFAGCYNLTSITIPDSVTSIGDDAFAGCHNLRCITIPDSVTSIGKGAFYGCVGLADSQGLVIVRDVLYTCQNGLTHITIPGSVTSIGNRAFNGCHSLLNITIPDSVTSIGEFAFAKCSNLTSITIPKSVINIEEGGFVDCPKLSHIKATMKLSTAMLGRYDDHVAIVIDDPALLPNDLKQYAVIGFTQTPDNIMSERSKKHLKYIKANAVKLMELAFQNPKLIQLMCENKLLTPDVAQAYLDNAQSKQATEATAILLDYQHNKLTQTDHKKNIARKEKQETEILERAIARIQKEGIEGLVFAITGDIPDNIHEAHITSRMVIKELLEAQKAKLATSITAKVDYLVTNNPEETTEKNKKADALGIEKISWDEFAKRIAINNLFVTNNTVIGVADSDVADMIMIPDGVTAIGDEAFFGCRDLKRITIPDSVTSIGNKAFLECSGLVSVTIPDSVTSIGRRAFCGCMGLADNQGLVIVRDVIYDCKKDATSIIIPDGVTRIGDDAFFECGDLMRITIPDSVTSIGNFAFFGCRRLTSITIPNSVTSIGDWAFGDVDSVVCNLASITFLADEITFYHEPFHAYSSLKTIYAHTKVRDTLKKHKLPRGCKLLPVENANS